LLNRERTGEGQNIDAAILDTYFHMHEMAVPVISLRAGKWTIKRNGSQHPTSSPNGTFRCGNNGYIYLTPVLPHQWNGLAVAMGQPGLATDPRFVDDKAR